MVKRGYVIVVNNVRVVYVWCSCDCVVAKRHNDVKSSVQAFFFITLARKRENGDVQLVKTVIMH